MFTLLHMRHLTAAETQRYLNLIPLGDELLGIIHLGVKVIRIDIR